jgi:hypothetical protein
MLLVCVATGLLAYALSPHAGVHGAASLAAKSRERGAGPLARTIEYEWADTFRENESGVVAVHFRDPECAARASAIAPRRSAPAELAESEVTVTLGTQGFEVSPREKRIVLRYCDQRLAWDVLPVRAPSHALQFRFETVLGDAEVSPARFEVPVVGSLFLPSEVLSKGTAAISALTGIFVLASTLAALRQWTGKVRDRLRRAPKA